MNIQASPLGEKGKPEKRIAFCATMGAEIPFLSPYFTTFPGQPQAGRKIFHPSFKNVCGTS
jgi:hypothetical protein